MTHRYRLDDIIAARRERQSYRQIGQPYGLSRERIRQILARHAPELTGRSYTPLPQGKTFYPYICQHCHQQFSSVARQAKFCSPRCAGRFRALYRNNPYPHGTPAARHFYYEQRKLYHPEQIAAQNARAHARHIHRLATEPGYKQAQLDYHRKWYAKHRLTSSQV